MDLNTMMSVQSMEPQQPAAVDPLTDTLNKLAQQMDYSVPSYLLIESLRMMNEKINKNQGMDNMMESMGGGTSTPLINPFTLTTEAGPSLS